MRSQNDNPVFLVRFQHVPEVPTGAKVHSRRGLIEQDKFGATAQGDRY